MQLYEQAIHSAHANGFIHNEAIAYEVAARFYAARGFDKIADAYFLEARYGYLRWGAEGKVRQLDQAISLPGSGDGDQSLASSGEMVLEKLIDRLMRAAIEHAGPESLVRYVMRTREIVILDDASVETPFSEDPYIVQCRARSILCLPLINQTKQSGATCFHS